MATIETNAELGRQVVDDAKRYVLHSWSVQDAIDPIPVAGGEGRYFWDYDGKRYLDFASQLVNVSIGHQHPKVIAAIREQAEKLCTIGPPMATEPRSKLTRWYTGRHKIVARYRSYHGATAGAITATGDPRRWFAEPGLPGIVRMLDPYTYRCPAGHPDPCPVCTGAPHLEEILQYEGPQNIAAVIMETIVGTNGVIVPPDGYLQGIREPLAEWVQDKCFAGGLTYSGHVLACAAAIASIEAFREEGIVENAAAMGAALGDELAGLAERHPSIGEV